MLDVALLTAVVLVAIAMALSLAHALEMPGKKRLDRETYYEVQSIYYPGFTFGGAVGEFGGMFATLAVLFLVPLATADFWLALAAFVALVAMQGIYWLFTHPVNRFWVEGEKLDRVSAGFFALGASRAELGATKTPQWTELRDRWEHSHVARAVLGALSFVMLLFVLA